MGNTAHAVTDLVLGLVTLTCAAVLLRALHIDRGWHLTFWFAGASELAGAAHHGLFHAEWSWIVVGVLVVITISYLLVASAREILHTRGARIVTAIRTVGVAAYAVAVALGESGLQWLLLSESVTMACILALWTYAAHLGHAMAMPMTVAILAHGLAGIAFVLPLTLTAPIGLDSTSLSHLAQIPGVLLLYRAVVRGAHTRHSS